MAHVQSMSITMLTLMLMQHQFDFGFGYHLVVEKMFQWLAVQVQMAEQRTVTKLFDVSLLAAVDQSSDVITNKLTFIF
jgi:hypothetical protein